jgi:hypothetical protein
MSNFSGCTLWGELSRSLMSAAVNADISDQNAARLEKCGAVRTWLDELTDSL